MFKNTKEAWKYFKADDRIKAQSKIWAYGPFSIFFSSYNEEGCNMIPVYLMAVYQC